jgi:predicted permease
VYYLDVSRRSAGSQPVEAFAYVDYQILTNRARSFELLAAESQNQLPTEYRGIAGTARISFVTGDLFRMTRRGALAGRYPATDDEWSQGPTTAVVSSHFASTLGKNVAELLGTSLSVSGRQYEIVAIAPDEFRGTGLGHVDLWLPLLSVGSAILGPGWQVNPGATFLTVLARIKQGVPPLQARAELAAILESAIAAGAHAATAVDLRLVPVGDPDYAFGRREGVLPFVLLALGGSLFAVSICSAMLLCWAIALALESELRTRRALGASTLALVRLVLARLWLLFLFGSAAGVVVATAIAGGAQALGLADATLTPTALAIAFTLSTIAGLLCSLPAALVIPFARTGGLRVAQQLGARRSRVHASRGLVVGQISVSFTLGVLTLLLAGSLISLVRFNPGIDADRVIAIDVTGGTTGRAADLERVLIPLAERLAVRPDVQGVALALTHPFGTSVDGMFIVPDADTTGPARVQPTMNAVGADYLHVVGLKLLRGRDIRTSDALGTERVAVVSAGFEGRYLRGQSAVGRCVRMSGTGAACTRIVGVVQNFIQHDIMERDVPRILVPLAQFTNPAPLRTLVVRTRLGVPNTSSAIRAAIREIDVSRMLSATLLHDRLAAQAAPWTRVAGLSSLFGGLALAVSLFGVYGLTESRVHERRTEFGLRAALGAPPGRTAWLVLREAMTLTAAGLAVGCVLALIVMPRFESLLTTSRLQAVWAFMSVGVVVVTGVILVVFNKAIETARMSPSGLLRGG